jgi:hypothetical protein
MTERVPDTIDAISFQIIILSLEGISRSLQRLTR